MSCTAFFFSKTYKEGFPIIHLLIVLSLILSCKAQTQSAFISLAFEKDLIPEGIAIDYKSKKIYLNSLTKKKIVRSNLDGSQAEDFIENGEYGYLSGFGMTIKGDTLFALGNSLQKPNNSSVLLLLNTKTQEPIKSYSLENSGFAYLNDLAFDRTGNVFITDSESNSIYTINDVTDGLEVFYADDAIKHSNGIAISKDGSYLYLATYTSGIRILDIASKKLANPPNNYKGIDGMKFFENSLIAIVNSKRDPSENGVYKFDLNSQGSKIVTQKKLFDLNKASDIPTTFDILDTKMYFIADSQMDYLDQQTNAIIDASRLENYRLIIHDLEPFY